MTQGDSRTRWCCPECGARITSVAPTRETADAASAAVVREHLELHHPDSADLTNATAAASWLAAAGHLVELWAGPFDGAQVWCPPGELPQAIGVHRTPSGEVVPLRSALARLLPHVASYHQGETVGRERVRYLYHGRAG